MTAFLAIITTACWAAYFAILWATRPRKPAIDLTPHLPVWAARKRRR